MKIFTYGINKNLYNNLQNYFREVELVDVSNQYQDILALSANIVVVSESYCSRKILNTIKEFEAETKYVDDTIYIYLTLEHEKELAKVLERCYEEGRRKWYLRWILTEL